jgi:hypothetical protein
MALAWVAVWLIAGAVPAAAQDRWIQIEAHSTEQAAIDRARAWSEAFPDVSGFALPSGWYAIVLGPQAAEDAALRLGLLRGEGLIPRDSFLADGRGFGARFWPGPGPGPGGAPTPPPPAARAAGTGTLAEARADEAALDRPARREIQTALAWFGHYGAAIDGAFGPITRAAISDWQTAQGAAATGVLTPAEREALLAAWRAALDAIGLARVTEAEAGIEIDLPLGLVEFTGYEPPFVSYAPRGDSGVQVLLISQPGDQAALFALYDRIAASALMPPGGPRERRARSFEIRGANAETEAFAHAELAGGLIKGFAVSWRAADAARMARVLEAMRASFRAVGDRALDPGIVPLDPEVKAGMLTGLEPRRPARLRSGVWVDGQGAVLTAAEAVAGCGSLTIEGGVPADVALLDAVAGVAVLRPRAALAPARLAAAGPLPRPGAQVAVAGFPFGPALAAPVVTFGTFAADGGLAGETGVARASLAALPGDRGGPVLDAAGAMVGILVPVPDTDGRVLPPDVAYLVPAGVLAPVLAAAGIVVPAAARDGALAPEDVTAVARALTVQISCWD